MEKRMLTCIRCPRGCSLVAEVEGGVVTSVTGNSCPRGVTYATAEITNPVRVVTSTVPVEGSNVERMVSVKTAGDVPKDKVFEVVGALRGVTMKAPVQIGDVVVANAAGTGVDVVATKRA